MPGIAPRRRRAEARVEGAHEAAGGEVVGHQHVADQSHALAVERGLHRHGLHGEARPAGRVDVVQAGRQQPHAPARLGVFPVDVQQGVVAQIVGLNQGVLAAQERRAADRRVDLAEQPVDPHPVVAAGAVAHRHVGVVARQVDPTVGAVDADLDVRVPAAETLEPGHQPHGAERGADADGQHPALAVGAHLLDPLGQRVEALAERRQGRLAGIGQAQRAGQAAEQGAPGAAPRAP